VAGLEAGMDTVLVLSGITTHADIERFPYRPSAVVDSIARVPVGRDVHTIDGALTGATRRPAPTAPADDTAPRHTTQS
ncbi:HAD hydrolase-like protein, partial [Frankia sp. AvcI1]